MRTGISITLFTLFFSLSFITTNAAPSDSIRLERKDGQLFIVHKVDPKETLYSISRRYNVPIRAILKNNPEVKSGLEIGDTLFIPYHKDDGADKNAGIHVVKPSETLFYISKLYDVPIEDIRKWNDLKGNALNVGQKLIIKKADEEVKYHIVKASETLFSISREYNIMVSDLREWNDLKNNNISIGQNLIVNPGSPESGNEGLQAKNDSFNKSVENEDNEEEKITESDVIQQNVDEVEDETEDEEDEVKDNSEIERTSTPRDYKRVVENGLAAMVDGSSENKKYLALHRTAEVGTIMQVRNEMNNRVVFVRVIGRLPDTGVNNGIILRLSKAAYERLGAIDKKFRVEVSYVP